ncbi:hypothetical protein [uncultured Brevundimonas sp.]|uniref:head-tail joining protein n=1 Tax=uncultured Brevundimonas sp. TaxID=213418 RepID=UPI0025D39C9A|nr:hypothetical protein [uncultured Brevundimonas sp.]
MVGFSDLLGSVDDDVEEHLCDDGLYLTEAGEIPVRVMMDHPRAGDRLSGMAFTRSRPTMRVRRAACPELREGHLFRVGSDTWAVAEAPVADGDGAWWAFEAAPG